MAMTKGKRRLILFGLALGMAGLAALLIKTYLAHKTAELEASYADHTEKSRVVVANADLPAGARVEIKNFAVRQMPADMVPPDAILPGEIERAEGQRLKMALPLGRPLLWGYLSSGVNPSFSEMLDEDKRALTIAVDELNSISGMIRPYDRIDLFIVGRERQDAPDARNAKDIKVVMPLLQDVLVKATGSIVRRETAQDGREYDRRYSTLTLDLMPEEIGKVLIAQENGELKAALKRPEQGATRYRPTHESDLWASTSSGVKGGVTFYVGGKSGGMLKSVVQPFGEDSLPVGGAEDAAKTEAAQNKADESRAGKDPAGADKINEDRAYLARQVEEIGE
jgi:pilus assembly protein CpaB